MSNAAVDRDEISVEDSGLAGAKAASVLLRIHDLQIEYETPSGPVRAIDGVDFEISPREIVGIVGESGSGKSTLARSIVQLLPTAARHPNGTIELDGINVLRASDQELRTLRGTVAAYAFQDADAALDPLMRIGSQIAEARKAHGRPSRAKDVLELLEMVGMTSPEIRIRQYPHELSGGMRQRAMLAIALANHPKLLLADEPTTALDASSRMHVLRLLRQLRDREGLAILLITHDIGTAAALCDRIVVMYSGQVMEEGSTSEVIGRPRHRYAAGLIGAVPRIDNFAAAPLQRIEGDPPSGHATSVGCAFAPRCSAATNACLVAQPPLIHVGHSHRHACLHPIERGE